MCGTVIYEFRGCLPQKHYETYPLKCPKFRIEDPSRPCPDFLEAEIESVSWKCKGCGGPGLSQGMQTRWGRVDNLDLPSVPIAEAGSKDKFGLIGAINRLPGVPGKRKSVEKNTSLESKRGKSTRKRDRLNPFKRPMKDSPGSEQPITFEAFHEEHYKHEGGLDIEDQLYQPTTTSQGWACVGSEDFRLDGWQCEAFNDAAQQPGGSGRQPSQYRDDDHEKNDAPRASDQVIDCGYTAFDDAGVEEVDYRGLDAEFEDAREESQIDPIARMAESLSDSDDGKYRDSASSHYEGEVQDLSSKLRGERESSKSIFQADNETRSRGSKYSNGPKVSLMRTAASSVQPGNYREPSSREAPHSRSHSSDSVYDDADWEEVRPTSSGENNDFSRNTSEWRPQHDKLQSSRTDLSPEHLTQYAQKNSGSPTEPVRDQSRWPSTDVGTTSIQIPFNGAYRSHTPAPLSYQSLMEQDKGQPVSRHSSSKAPGKLSGQLEDMAPQVSYTVTPHRYKDKAKSCDRRDELNCNESSRFSSREPFWKIDEPDLQQKYDSQPTRNGSQSSTARRQNRDIQQSNPYYISPHSSCELYQSTSSTLEGASSLPARSQHSWPRHFEEHDSDYSGSYAAVENQEFPSRRYSWDRSPRYNERQRSESGIYFNNQHSQNRGPRYSHPPGKQPNPHTRSTPYGEMKPHQSSRIDVRHSDDHYKREASVARARMANPTDQISGRILEKEEVGSGTTLKKSNIPTQDVKDVYTAGDGIEAKTHPGRPITLWPSVGNEGKSPCVEYADSEAPTKQTATIAMSKVPSRKPSLELPLRAEELQQREQSWQHGVQAAVPQPLTIVKGVETAASADLTKEARFASTRTAMDTASAPINPTCTAVPAEEANGHVPVRRGTSSRAGGKVSDKVARVLERSKRGRALIAGAEAQVEKMEGGKGSRITYVRDRRGAMEWVKEKCWHCSEPDRFALAGYPCICEPPCPGDREDCVWRIREENLKSAEIRLAGEYTSNGVRELSEVNN